MAHDKHEGVNGVESDVLDPRGLTLTSKPPRAMIELAHLLILGRPARNDKEIDRRLKAKTIAALRQSMMRSPEFRENWEKFFQSEDFFFFIHIPKTAGGSLRRYFKDIFGKRCEWFAKNERLRERGTEIMRSDMAVDDEFFTRLRMCGGHIPFAEIPQAIVDKRPIFISVTRHPVQRALSLYNYLQTTERHNAHERMANVTLYEALTQDKRFLSQCDLTQVRYLTGSKDAAEAKSFLEQHRCFIGKQESLDDFFEAMSEEFGFPLMSSPKKHISAPTYLAEIASQPRYEEAIDILTKTNADEIAFLDSMGSVWSSLPRKPKAKKPKRVEIGMDSDADEMESDALA